MPRRVVPALLVLTSWALLPSQALGDPPLYEITPERIERLTYSTGGQTIAEPFLYRAGDDSDWASPALDDSAWEQAHTSRPAARGTGWYRMRLVKAPELEGQQLGLAVVGHGGPFEVYLDGRLILQSGRVAESREDERGGPGLVPVPLPELQAGQEHLLAVRFSNHAAASPFAMPWGGFSVVLGRFDALVGNRSMHFWQAALFLTITLLLTFQHLLLYLFYRKRRESLYFSAHTGIIALFQATYFLHWISADAIVSGVSMRIWVAAMAITGVTALLFVYEIFSMDRPRLFALAIPVTAAIAVWALVQPLAAMGPVRMLLMVLSLEILRVMYVAYRQRKPGAVLLSAGVVPISVFMVVEQAAYMGWWQVPWLPYFSAVFYGFVLLVVVMAVHLARDFARAHDAVQVAHDRLEEANRTLEDQVAHRTAELQASLEHLQSAQERLVQQEKLASLGALTAGIAHEIKNPLNFVNNFGQLTAELSRELHDCLAAGDEKEIALLLEDLEHNAAKVVEHGRRADGIVRSMLMHSRGGRSQRQAVDLNALAREYGGLAYHGMRAQRADFNCDLIWDLDEDLPPVEVTPQELGRVLMNVINNAFYAVSSVTDGTGAARVEIQTASIDDSVQIRITDSGPGIPEDVRRHIFEPFFTTKPTGEGTGLGLSMSHEIILGHGGDIAVESSEGEGTSFIVTLPVSTEPAHTS